MDNCFILSFHEDTFVKYAVGARRDAMTMVVCISGDCRSIIEALMLIFTNKNSTYSICRLNDSILKVCYRSSPKGWMNQSLFFQYFTKP